ncbi:MAG: hypothetical protein ACOC0P_00335 [Planctomycetota bacterium]
MTTIAKRTMLMAGVWLMFAVLIHVGLTQWPAFVQGLAVAVLKVDIGNAWYGDAMLRELRERVGRTGMAPELIRDVTDRVLESYADAPEQIGSGQTPLPEPTQWLDLAQRTTLVTRDQMARWLRHAPPPVFSVRPVVPAIEGVGPVVILIAHDSQMIPIPTVIHKSPDE